MPSKGKHLLHFVSVENKTMPHYTECMKIFSELIDLKEKLSLYIHIPFCVKKCRYCDFPSWAGCEADFESYVNSLAEELKEGSYMYSDYEIDTVFIGGGTPTVLPPGLLGKIADVVLERYNLSRNAEFTCEANPGTVDGKKLREMRAMEINRLSFGVQAWQNDILKTLGRIHDRDLFLKNLAQAKEAGFKNINCDLMFSLPNQTLDNWQETLEKITALDIQHVSAYSLIVEEGTVFGDMNEKGLLKLPDEETDRKMYYLANEILADRGFERYEISNFAKKGFESRHNITYWETRPYIGFGLGSHSYFNGERFNNTYDMKSYIAAKGKMPLIRENIETLTENMKTEEFMFMGLRMTKGISKDEFKARFKNDIESVYGSQLKYLKEEKLLQEKDGRLFLTEKGTDISNFVFEKFML